MCVFFSLAISVYCLFADYFTSSEWRLFAMIQWTYCI